jgi:hypothetical protein
VQNDHLHDKCPTGYFKNDTKICPVGFFQQEKNEDQLDNKVIKAALLSYKHFSMASNYKFYSTNSYGNRNADNKRMRTQGPSGTYDRLCIFADLSDPPHCFAVILNNPNQSDSFFLYCKAEIAPGRVFYIFEPDFVNRTCGDHSSSSLPIVWSQHPLLPLKHDPKRHIPFHAVMMPTRVLDHVYFTLHNLKISVQRPIIDIKDACCKGQMCDRQLVLDRGQSCGCYFDKFTQNPIVVDMNVSLPVSKSINENGKFIVEHFRSLRTTLLFVENLSDFSRTESKILQDKFHELRQSIQKMVEIVNDANGWTIFGWFRQGEVADSSTQGEKVANEETTIHISMLVPSELDDLKLPEFKQERIKC